VAREPGIRRAPGVNIVFKVSREWATPATAGAFLIMAVTGVLMFFHLDTGLNKLAHEWLGWGLLAAVVAHALANWVNVKRYVVSSTKAQAMLATAAVVLAASFIRLDAEPPSPPALALQAVGNAPLTAVLALNGKGFDQAQRELATVGITAQDGSQTLQGLTAGDRGQMGRAVRVLLAPAR
jgi:hypothetical protein